MSLRGLGSFGASTVLSGGVSLLSIPLIVLLTDPAAWASIAVGQAVGSSLGVLAMFGWGITGPAAVAMMDSLRHTVAYWDSIRARLLLFVPIVLAAVVITLFLAPTQQLAAGICAVSMALGGLSGSWYLVGRNKPHHLLVRDTIPRVAGSVLGVLGLWASHSLVLFGALQLLGSLAAFGLVTVWVVPGLRRPEGAVQGFGGVLGVIRDQRHGVLVAVAIAFYYPVVLAIVAVLAPAALPVYALIEKVLRFAGLVMQPLLQYLQATVPAAGDLPATIRRSLAMISVLSIVCWAGFTSLLPFAATILGAGQVRVPWLIAINLGVYMGSVLLMNYLSTVALVAVGRASAIAPGALLGTAGGLAVTAVCAWLGGGSALSWGFVATSVLVLGLQLYSLFRALRTFPEVAAGLGSVDAA